MIPDERIRSVVESEVGLLGYELVKLDIISRSRRHVLRLFIDREGKGVTVDDCVKVSKAVGFVLEGEENIQGPYNLEVSSPGINRPLIRLEHFERFVGHTARIEFTGGAGEKKTIIGEISSVGNGEVVIVSEGGESTISFDRIIRANLHGEDWNVGSGKGKGKRRSGRNH